MPALIAVVALALFAWSAVRRDADAERVRDACTALARDAAAGRVERGSIPVALELLRDPVADLLASLDGTVPQGIDVRVEVDEEIDDAYRATVRASGRDRFRLSARTDDAGVSIVGFERLDAPRGAALDGAAGLPGASSAD